MDTFYLKNTHKHITIVYTRVYWHAHTCTLTHLKTDVHSRNHRSIESLHQHSATTLQHTASETSATHCNTHFTGFEWRYNAVLWILQHTATHCNTLQHTATHCNSTHYTTLQHKSTEESLSQTESSPSLSSESDLLCFPTLLRDEHQHNAQHNVPLNAQHTAQHTAPHNAQHNAPLNAPLNAPHSEPHNAQHNAQPTAAYCTAHCNTLQHVAARCFLLFSYPMDKGKEIGLQECFRHNCVSPRIICCLSCI